MFAAAYIICFPALVDNEALVLYPCIVLAWALLFIICVTHEGRPAFKRMWAIGVTLLFTGVGVCHYREIDKTELLRTEIKSDFTPALGKISSDIKETQDEIIEEQGPRETLDARLYSDVYRSFKRDFSVTANPKTRTPAYASDFYYTALSAKRGGIVVGNINVGIRECYPDDFKTQIIVFYVPHSSIAFDICAGLAKLRAQICTLPKGCAFTGNVFLYYNNDFSSEQLDQLREIYKRNGMDVTSRGIAYAVATTPPQDGKIP